MQKQRILVIGACGQIGVELTLALRKIYGNNNVIASDLRAPIVSEGLFEQLDVLNRQALIDVVQKHKITQIDLLAAVLSATGEKNPMFAWELNMNSLLYVLELAKEQKKLSWQRSIQRGSK
jgi:nucleoside-diphosphate-sugar epimerase